jgi:tetratricopeptide (TPR) repeat protein
VFYTSEYITEEPDAVVPHIRFCVGGGSVMARSTTMLSVFPQLAKDAMKKIILISTITFLLFAFLHNDFRREFFQKEVEPEFWGTIPHIDRLSNRIMKLDFNSQSLVFSIGKTDGTIEIRDASDLNKKIIIKAHKMRISSLVSSNDGELFASSSSTVDETTKVWDSKTGKSILEIPNTRGPEVFSNDRNILYIAHNSKLFIYDLLNQKFFPGEYKANGVVQSLAVSSDGKFLAVGTTGKVQIWQIEKKLSGIFFWQKLEGISLDLDSEKTLYGLKNWIQAIAFSKDNKQITTISRFGGIDILDAPSLSNRKQHKIKRTQVNTVNYIDSEGVFIVTAMTAIKGKNARYITSYVKPSPLKAEDAEFSFNNKCQSQFPYVFQNPRMAFTANVEALFYLAEGGKLKKHPKVLNSEGCQLPPSAIPDCDKEFKFVKSPENKVSEDGFTVFYDGQDSVVLPNLVKEALETQKKYGCNKRYDTSHSKTKVNKLKQSIQPVPVKELRHLIKPVTIHYKSNQNPVPIKLNPELDSRTQKLNIKGESYYAEQNYDAAYQVFEEVVQLDSYNVRALNNLAIVSLKIGNKNKAIISSHRVIYSLPASAKEKAAALFNMGLACEGIRQIQILGERRREPVDRMLYCLKDSLEFYTQSYITYPSKGRSDFILKIFTNAKTPENECQLNDGHYKSYFKHDNRFIFLHEKQQPDFLNGLTNEAHGNTSHLKKTATGKLTNGLYISSFWSPSSKTINLDNESCEIFTGMNKTHSQAYSPD